MNYLERFIQTNQKVPVVEFGNKVHKEPLVSVCVVTYQQEKYVAQCLDGIINQQTNFPFEILVGEDDSDDKTREICLEYAKKYPEKIRLFLHSEANKVEHEGKKTGSFNFRYNIHQSRGKYIALCDGDDFWTNENKLQMQVNFLEEHSDFGLVYGDIVLIDEEGQKMEEPDWYINQVSRYKSGSVFWELLEKNFINTLTILTYKELILDYINHFYEEFSYDYRLWLHIASLKKVKYIDKKVACYRVHKSGISRIPGYFDQRTPLVKQSALSYYFNKSRKLSTPEHKYIFAKVIKSILLNKNLPLKVKLPTIRMLLLNWFGQ